MKELREIKSAQLDDIDEEKPGIKEIEAATDNYKDALLNELELRHNYPRSTYCSPEWPIEKGRGHCGHQTIFKHGYFK